MTCKDCIHHDLCSELDTVSYHLFRNGGHCRRFKNKADFAEMVRCKDCQYAEELDKHCEINRSAYKHCILLRGDETRNVWHKYAKYYKDYSLVESEDFCSAGIRRESK
jgi:hypothetical protein